MNYYDKPFILGKIYSNPKYTMDLLDGNIFINPLAVFGAGKILSKERGQFNKYRDDLNEGLSNNIDVNKLNYSRVISFYQDIGGIPRDVNAVGEIDTHFLEENIYCLSALFYDYENGKLLNLDKKMNQFTDENDGLAIVIYDVKEFLYRIMRTLSDALGSLYWIGYGLVDYNFDKKDNIETDEFTKEHEFNYQQEFRIAINIIEDRFRVRKNTKGFKYFSDSGAISLSISSIKDIAFVLSVKDYLDLKFPDEYKWLKTNQPERISTFYPPIQNKLSYICPLMRIDGVTLISEKGLYPANRNLNAFSINLKRLEKTVALNPTKDSFFLLILNSYFGRLLDIAKSKKDEKLINQLLTAIMHYMMALNIDNCAGVHLIIEKGYLHAYYDDLPIHDSSLNDENCYEEIYKKILLPQPTDFTVLVTLSNQVEFDEYEYEGKKYVRIEIARDGILPSGKVVKKGDVEWAEVSKIKWIGV